MTNQLYGVLNPQELAHLCQTFNLREDELVANFDGDHKRILMSKELVFLFPRNPNYVAGLKNELSIYESFTKLGNVPLPKLAARVKNKNISYFEFGVTTRLFGDAYSRHIYEMPYEQTAKLLEDLAHLTATWHSLPSHSLPNFLSLPKPSLSSVSASNWHEKVLDPASTRGALHYFCTELRREMGRDLFWTTFNDDDRSIWATILTELSSLKPVLIHGDIHEDQILIDGVTKQITGLLDWETARLANPVMDFNLVEWGLPIWELWFERYEELRRLMWRSYLNKRGIRLSTFDGLHLFYTMAELMLLTLKKDAKKIAFTGKDYRESLAIYIARLERASSVIKLSGINNEVKT